MISPNRIFLHIHEKALFDFDRADHARGTPASLAMAPTRSPGLMPAARPAPT